MMRRFRKREIMAAVIISVLFSSIFPTACMAQPTMTNKNKNSLSSEKSYPASQRGRVSPVQPETVSDDITVSEDLIRRSEEVSEDDIPEEGIENELSMNKVENTASGSKYKDIPLLHLPYDEFMRLNAAWFYRDGMYDRQGVNVFNYRGTCSEAAEATVMNRLFNTNVYTENNVLTFAGMLNSCTMGNDPVYGGAQSAVQMVQVFNHIGDLTGDHVEANYLTNGFVPKPNRTAELLVSGNQIIMSVAPCVLWDYPKEESIASGIDYWSPNHWIVVTAPKFNKKNQIEGFYIVDSSGYGQNYLPISKYKNCVWGPTGKEVYNQACVIIKKKNI